MDLRVSNIDSLYHRLVYPEREEGLAFSNILNGYGSHSFEMEGDNCHLPFPLESAYVSFIRRGEYYLSTIFIGLGLNCKKSSNDVFGGGGREFYGKYGPCWKPTRRSGDIGYLVLQNDRPQLAVSEEDDENCYYRGICIGGKGSVPRYLKDQDVFEREIAFLGFHASLYLHGCISCLNIDKRNNFKSLSLDLSC